jgi:hypothetical protein
MCHSSALVQTLRGPRPSKFKYDKEESDKALNSIADNAAHKIRHEHAYDQSADETYG